MIRNGVYTAEHLLASFVHVLKPRNVVDGGELPDHVAKGVLGLGNEDLGHISVGGFALKARSLADGGVDQVTHGALDLTSNEGLGSVFVDGKIMKVRDAAPPSL